MIMDAIRAATTYILVSKLEYCKHMQVYFIATFRRFHVSCRYMASWRSSFNVLVNDQYSIQGQLKALLTVFGESQTNNQKLSGALNKSSI